MNAPLLETSRLLLRSHQLGDFNNCFQLWSDKTVTKYITGRASTSEEVWARMLRYTGHWQMLGYGYFLVIDKSNQAVVGEVGIAHYHRDTTMALNDPPEAGWALLPRYQGLGLACEALTSVLSWAEDHGIIKTTCRIDPRNGASLRLAELVGYRKYGEFTEGEERTVLLERVSTI